jgi:uncharacterized protein
MRPYFFGAPGRRLFGVHHEPQAAAVGHGVVLCYPMGHEYVNALRGYRQLAVQLARRGLHVLRFDYSGSGDSAGAGEQSDLTQWLEDIGVAIADLMGRHDLGSVSLVGLRLGGTLATLVASDRCDVRSLVVWEPVVRGSEYLAELRRRHHAFFASEAREGRHAASRSGSSEMMGFPLSQAMCAELERIDLRELSRLPAPQVLAIGEGDEQFAMIERFRSLCGQVDHRSIPGQQIWAREVGAPRALVPQSVLDAITDWFGATTP